MTTKQMMVVQLCEMWLVVQAIDAANKDWML